MSKCPVCKTEFKGKDLTEDVNRYNDKMEKELEKENKKKFDKDIEKAVKENTSNIDEKWKTKLDAEKEKFDGMKEGFDSLKEREINFAKKQLEAEFKSGLKEKDAVLKEMGKKIKDLESGESDTVRGLQDEITKIKNDFSVKEAKLIRQIQNKTPGELGEKGQIEAREILEKAFPRDIIKETKPGKPGSDVFQTVMHGFEEAGLIIYEVKNTGGWKKSYLTQAKKQKITHKTNTVVIVSNRTPNEKPMSEQEGVIIIKPECLKTLASILRTYIIELFKSGASEEEKDEMADRLLDYLKTPEFQNAVEETREVLAKMYKERMSEEEYHNKNWNKRDNLESKLMSNTIQVNTRIKAIVENRSIKIDKKIKKKKKIAIEV